MTQSVSASPIEYPNPKPVLTATAIGYRPEDSGQIVMVRLARPEDPNRPYVVPGGIFDVGRGRHTSQLDVAKLEFGEEVGTGMAWVEEPEQFMISQRLAADRRYWCSCPTVMGANDCIVAGPVGGRISPNDTGEVAKAFWIDVNALDLHTVGRGHCLVLRVWQTIVSHGGLNRQVLFDPDFRAQLLALSDERWTVDISQLTGMIYLHDTHPVSDDRPLMCGSFAPGQ